MTKLFRAAACGMAVMVFVLAAQSLALCGSLFGPDEPVEPLQDYRASVHRADTEEGLVASSLYAADVLAEVMRGRIGHEHAIVVPSLSDLNDLERSSALGRVVAHQVASRLNQHGYRVVEHGLRGEVAFRPGNGEFMLTRDANKLLTPELSAGAAMAGTYAATVEEVFVSLRVTRLSDGVVVGAYEYVLPRRGVVSRLLGPLDDDRAWSGYAARMTLSDIQGLAPGTRVPSLEEAAPTLRPLPAPAPGAGPLSGDISGLDERDIPEGFPTLRGGRVGETPLR